MEFVDFVWLGLILGGAGWLLYRSFGGKKKGHCGSGGNDGCGGCGCSKH